jgi:pyruvate formate lyase activating enzyme
MTSSAAPRIACSLAPTAEHARVFNIQRYSLNDGAGIRTLVFFKGCPLHCPWCSNPESRSRDAVFVRREARCIHCANCAQDVDECPSGAYQRMGDDYTQETLLAEVMKDEVFFRVSGGGVTLSGGEVLSQAGFATRFLATLKSLGIATAIETSGHGKQDALLEMARHCDEVLYDFKIMDAARAHAITGINLTRVLDNFAALYAQASASTQLTPRLIPRLPLIPGYTMDMDNLVRVLDFLAPYGLSELHLLPFHQYGAGKYGLVGIDYALGDLEPPDEQALAPFVERARAAGYRVTVGG